MEGGSPQPLPQDQQANTMKSIGFPNISKESVSSVFPVLKCTVKESGVGYDEETKSSVC